MPRTDTEISQANQVARSSERDVSTQAGKGATDKDVVMSNTDPERDIPGNSYPTNENWQAATKDLYSARVEISRLKSHSSEQDKQLHRIKDDLASLIQEIEGDEDQRLSRLATLLREKHAAYDQISQLSQQLSEAQKTIESQENALKKIAEESKTKGNEKKVGFSFLTSSPRSLSDCNLVETRGPFRRDSVRITRLATVVKELQQRFQDWSSDRGVITNQLEDAVGQLTSIEEGTLELRRYVEIKMDDVRMKVARSEEDVEGLKVLVYTLNNKFKSLVEATKDT